MSQENQNPLGNQLWEFIRSMDNLGIDPNGPPPPPPGAHPHPPPPGGAATGGAFESPWTFGEGYGGWGWGGRGRHGREPRAHAHEHRRHRSRTPSSSGSRSDSASPDPHTEGTAKEDREREREPPTSPRGDRGPHAHWAGRRGRRGCHRGRASFGPFGPFGAFGQYGGWHQPGGPQGTRGHHHRGPPPAWDLNTNAFLTNIASHPFVRNILQNIGSQMNTQNNDGDARNADNDDGAFTPPTDIFTTPTAYTLHVSLPGAKKEDIGVHYSATTSTLTISGVIYRPGNEEFLANMTSGERKVGMFEKNVVLRGRQDGGEVDGEGITAKLEDGVLAVNVPRAEMEWEDVKRVDIE